MSAIILRFPVERVRRTRRRGRTVFAAFEDGAALERATSRFTWLCTVVAAAVGVVLFVGVG